MDEKDFLDSAVFKYGEECHYKGWEAGKLAASKEYDCRYQAGYSKGYSERLHELIKELDSYYEQLQKQNKGNRS